jgi:hypothetical protein
MDAWLEEIRKDFWTAIDAFYEGTLHDDGEPIGLALFDPQVLVPVDWLAERTGFSEEEILTLVEEGILPRRRYGNDGLGFTLYTEGQIQFFKGLCASRLCSEAEIRHIIRFENDLIENGTLEVIPYDDQESPDFENLKRRVIREIQEITEQEEFLKRRNNHSSSTSEDVQRQLDDWANIKAPFEKLHRMFGEKTEGDLSTRQKEFYKKQLFRLRFLDEWLRIQDVHRYEAQIKQGYSPEFFFRQYSVRGDRQFTFGAPEWSLTLDRLKYSRSLGNQFPLRTPDFAFSEAGLTLKPGITSDRYSEIFESYQLRELFSTADLLGAELWNPPKPPAGMQKCISCNKIFKPRTPKHRYCSEDCRQKAKHRRWRERDPERARLATGRYFARNYPELFDDNNN